MKFEKIYKKKKIEEIKESVKDLDDEIKHEVLLELARLEYKEAFDGMEPSSDEEVIKWYKSEQHKKNEILDHVVEIKRDNIEGQNSSQPGIGGNGEPTNNQNIINNTNSDNEIEIGNRILESIQKRIDNSIAASAPPPKYIKDSLDPNAPYRINEGYIDYLYSLYSNNKAEDLKKIKEIIIELEEELIELNNAAPEKAGKSL